MYSIYFRKKIEIVARPLAEERRRSLLLLSFPRGEKESESKDFHTALLRIRDFWKSNLRKIKRDKYVSMHVGFKYHTSYI
jgi:hypothetical protein